MIRSDTITLRHLSFFDHLAVSRENAFAWLPAQAGLLLLRELDELFEGDAPSASPEGVRALRSLVDRIDYRSRARSPLDSMLRELQRPGGPRPRMLFAALLAYGHALETEIDPTIAADVFDSLSRYASGREPTYATKAKLCLASTGARH